MNKSTLTLLTLALFVGTSSPLHAADMEDPYWKALDPNTLKVKLGASTPSFKFSLKSNETKEKAEFSPATASKTGLSVSYKNFGLSLANQNPLEKKYIDKYGKTNATDFQLRFFGKLTYELTYQYYKGFYLTNTKAIAPADSTSYIKRPDINAINVGATVYWDIDEDEFLQAIAFDQNGQQLKAATGRSLLLHVSDSTIQAGSALLPSTAHSNFPGLSYLKNVDRRQVIIGGSYGGIYPWDEWYVAALVSLGIGYNQSELVNSGIQNETNNSVGTIGTFRFSIGRSGKTHGFGLNTFTEDVTSNYSYGEVNSTRTEVSLFYSYNFEDVHIPVANQLSDWLKF